MVTINWINNKNIGNKVSMLEFINKDASSIRGIFLSGTSGLASARGLNRLPCPAAMIKHFIIN